MKIKEIGKKKWIFTFLVFILLIPIGIFVNELHLLLNAPAQGKISFKLVERNVWDSETTLPPSWDNFAEEVPYGIFLSGFLTKLRIGWYQHSTCSKGSEMYDISMQLNGTKLRIDDDMVCLGFAEGTIIVETEPLPRQNYTIEVFRGAKWTDNAKPRYVLEVGKKQLVYEVRRG